jgi:hypothetical protein
LITIYYTKLSYVFDWLEQDLDLKIGRDWHWTWDNSTNFPAVEFIDPNIELIVQLKAKNL